MKTVINVVLAGLGGQGVIKASDVLSEAAFRAGYEVKKSELHGMSQRGGSVTSDVRFGPVVLSPMIPPGQAHFLLVLEPDQVEVNRGQLRPGGLLIDPSQIDLSRLTNRKSLNVALLGLLSAHLEIPEPIWLAALDACFPVPLPSDGRGIKGVGSSFPEKLHEANRQAFAEGRRAAESRLTCEHVS